MSSDAQLDYWRGAGGDEYTARNRVDWHARVPFWAHIIGIVQFGSVMEIGCNAGWNLWAIRSLNAHVSIEGIDVNPTAVRECEDARLNVRHAHRGVHGVGGKYDLIFTAGVLIHIAPDDIMDTMKAIVERSSRYVLAVEYADTAETAVPYRGRNDLLWRRDYGALYQSLGLSLVETGDAGAGFDRCTYWLMHK